jgi:hypothetical protein
MLAPDASVLEDIMKTPKEQAIDLISRLPADATWEEILYRLYVGRKIQAGLEAADEGRVLPHDEVKQLFAQEQ